MPPPTRHVLSACRSQQPPHGFRQPLQPTLIRRDLVCYQIVRGAEDVRRRIVALTQSRRLHSADAELVTMLL
jgi:hypothetical protein